MRLKLFVLVFFVFIFSTYVFAGPIDIKLEKDNYFSGETVQGRLFINDSVQEKIGITDFYLDLNGSIINVFPALIKFENFTYFYFDIPSSLKKGNYNFVVEDVTYLDNNILLQEDQIFNLNIDETNNTILTVNPGVVVIDLSKENSFELDIRNPSSNKISVNLSLFDDFISVDQNSFSLSKNSMKTIRGNIFSLFVDKSESSIFIDYGSLSYSIPVFISMPVPNVENNTVEENFEGTLSFLEDEFNITLGIDESTSSLFKIFNDLGKDISNVEISISGTLERIVDLESDEKLSISKGEILKNRFYINEEKNLTIGNYSGKIDLIYNGVTYDSIFMNILVSSESLENITNDNSKDDGENSEQKEDNSNLAFIAIIVIVLTLLIFVYVRYLISKKKFN